MTYKPFFPDIAFGWAFVGVLLAMLFVAAWIDYRTTRIPKLLSISMAATGLIANVIRGCWMGEIGLETWYLRSGSLWLGGLDGLMFAIVGLTFAFFLYFGMYVLGTCGGGDIKLAAALGAWIGWRYILYFLLVSVVVLLVWSIGNLLSGNRPSASQIKKAKAAAKEKKKIELPRGRVTFSASAMISAAIVMAWVFRYDLHLDEPPAAKNEISHALPTPSNG